MDCFYDVSYDRTIFDPTNTTCAGSPGNMMVFDESIDLYTSSNVSLNMIDPTKLPRVLDSHGNCVPLFPHSALRTNTIFEVVKASGGTRLGPTSILPTIWSTVRRVRA